MQHLQQGATAAVVPCGFGMPYCLSVLLCRKKPLVLNFSSFVCWPQFGVDAVFTLVLYLRCRDGSYKE